MPAQSGFVGLTLTNLDGKIVVGQMELKLGFG